MLGVLGWFPTLHPPLPLGSGSKQLLENLQLLETTDPPLPLLALRDNPPHTHSLSFLAYRMDHVLVLCLVGHVRIPMIHVYISLVLLTYLHLAFLFHISVPAYRTPPSMGV
jgi:hypothetical protein